MANEGTMVEAGPVEAGVRTFLATTAHSDVALSALSLAAAQSVDAAVPGSKNHSYSVESLRKLLDDLRGTVVPDKDESDPFAALLSNIL